MNIKIKWLVVIPVVAISMIWLIPDNDQLETIDQDIQQPQTLDQNIQQPQTLDQNIQQPQTLDQDNSQQTSYDAHHAIEDSEKPQEETIIKTFSHGDTTFTYQVGVENGVEETPAPSILAKMNAAYTQEELDQAYAEALESDYWKKRMELIGERGANSFAAKKADVDNNLTCDNFEFYAKKYVGQALPGFYINEKYVGTMEGYIYYKALNECIQPKHQEQLEKVMQELEEVYKEN